MRLMFLSLSLAACIPAPPEEPIGAGEGEGGGEGEGEGECPAGAFAGCGGDVVGTWVLETICPLPGESLSNPCESAFGDQAACMGDDDLATCTNANEATLTLNANGTGSMFTSTNLARHEDLSAACVSAVGNNEDPAAACAGLTSNTVTCTFADRRCGCDSLFPAGDETIAIDYTIDDDGFHFVPASSDPIDGPYCVDGDTLTLTNVFGWPAWIFLRGS